METEMKQLVIAAMIGAFGAAVVLTGRRRDRLWNSVCSAKEQ